MKVIVLTSSRADYSIYYPLLQKLRADNFFDLSVIAFGTHLSQKFGYTLRNIENDGFRILTTVDTMPEGDSPLDIAKSVGDSIVKFSNLWKELSASTDLIICLGDRYEMFAAVSASVPFNMNVAHIHGGETTEGAIDNVYRHTLTHIAKYHFTSTENHAKRVAELKGSNENVFNVGALGLESLSHVNLLDAKSFESKFSIPIKDPVLVTFHPETVGYSENEKHALEIVKVLENINDQVILTMPNSDTMGNCIRKHFVALAERNKNIFAVESLGMQGYYSALNLSKYVLGNSSSGIVEAASFGKYVIDLGNRQRGRDVGKNVIRCEIEAAKIMNVVDSIKMLPTMGRENIYWGGDVSSKIINVLKQINRIRN